MTGGMAMQSGPVARWLAMALCTIALAGCGDGRDMARPAPTTQTTIPAASDLPELSVQIVEPGDPTDTAADGVVPDTVTSAESAGPTTISDDARRDYPDLCEPFASLMALEESRSILAVQDQTSQDAAELKRQRELDSLRNALEIAGVTVDPEAAIAVQTLRIFPIGDGEITDANYERSLAVIRNALGTPCGVG